MDLAFWHGYLLADTGSNIFTRELVKALDRLGHSITLFCQDPAGTDRIGSAATVVRPPIGRYVPVFVEDGYPDLEARHVSKFDDADLARYIEVNAGSIRDAIDSAGIDFIFANHAIMGGPVAAAAASWRGTPFGVYVHGSELEYAIRGRPRLAELARSGLDPASAVFAGSRHVEGVTRELLGRGAYEQRFEMLSPGVDLDRFHPEGGSMEALLELLAGPPDPPGRRDPRRPDPDASERLREVDRFVLFAGKMTRQKGAHLIVEAFASISERHPDLHLVMVGFGPDRDALEESARGSKVVFTGAMAHEHLQLLMPLAEVVVVPSVVPEAFGMIAAEAAACGVPPIVARHSGLVEVAETLGDAAFTFSMEEVDLATVLHHALASPPADREHRRAAARARAAEHWSWAAVAARLVEVAAAAG